MSRAWDPADLVILAPGLRDRIGHEHEYTLMIAEAAIARGAAVKVVCPPPTEDLGLPGRTQAVLPAPRKPIRGRSLADRVRARLAPVHDRLDRRRYRRLFARNGQAVWLLHTAPYDEIARITRAFSEAGEGQLWVILRYDHYDEPSAVESVRRALAPAADPRIGLFADSQSLRALLQPLSPAEIRLAPIPVLAPPRRNATARTVGFFGAMRPQKGFTRLPALFSAASALDPELEFVVQAYRHPHDAPDIEIEDALAALRASPRVTLLESPLSSEQFHAALAGCAVLVTPYDAHVYRAGTSGVFTAGIAAGCAVLGTTTGWMREEADRIQLTRYFAADFANVADAGRALVEAAQVGAQPFQPTPAEAAWIRFNSAASLVERLGL
ncbi:hypothetical protein ASD89_07705 [Caulobacter sp. Root656]|nr:hypothetical protein ASD89_07705 [Caulobacter sp. Root656]